MKIKQTNEQTNKQTNKRTNKRITVLPENSPFLHSSLIRFSFQFTYMFFHTHLCALMVSKVMGLALNSSNPLVEHGRFLLHWPFHIMKTNRTSQLFGFLSYSPFSTSLSLSLSPSLPPPPPPSLSLSPLSPYHSTPLRPLTT